MEKYVAPEKAKRERFGEKQEKMEMSSWPGKQQVSVIAEALGSARLGDTGGIVFFPPKALLGGRVTKMYKGTTNWKRQAHSKRNRQIDG